MDPRVLEAMLPYFVEKFGNASSSTHAYGWSAEAAVQVARKHVANLINASESEIIFTSGATESCNMAIHGVLESYSAKGNHIITCATEHKAVYDTYKYHEKRGARVTYIPVNGDGTININALNEAMCDDTVLVSVMYANNETGVIHPIRQISNVVRSHGSLFLCDATQAVGKIPVDIHKDGIDLLACSAHKIYGPKGIGALYIRRKNPRVRISALITGGGQEKGLRAGTLNVPAIVGFGKAASLALTGLDEERERLHALRELLESSLLKLPGAKLHGSLNSRLPQTISVSFGVNNAFLMKSLPDLALSAGSACSSGSTDPSHVLLAMGIDPETAKDTIRISFGRFTNEKDITFAIQEISKTILNL